MTILNLEINKRDYEIACSDGEEEHRLDRVAFITTGAQALHHIAAGVGPP